jgi:hypothetical protein
LVSVSLTGAVMILASSLLQRGNEGELRARIVQALDTNLNQGVQTVNNGPRVMTLINEMSSTLPSDAARCLAGNGTNCTALSSSDASSPTFFNLNATSGSTADKFDLVKNFGLNDGVCTNLGPHCFVQRTTQLRFVDCGTSACRAVQLRLRSFVSQQAPANVRHLSIRERSQLVTLDASQLSNPADVDFACSVGGGILSSVLGAGHNASCATPADTPTCGTSSFKPLNALAGSNSSVCAELTGGPLCSHGYTRVGLGPSNSARNPSHASLCNSALALVDPVPICPMPNVSATAANGQVIPSGGVVSAVSNVVTVNAFVSPSFASAGMQGGIKMQIGATGAPFDYGGPFSQAIPVGGLTLFVWSTCGVISPTETTSAQWHRLDLNFN